MPSEHKYALSPGARLRQYRIVRLLGHGGFGLTYLAEDTNLNRKVAIKELLPMDFAIRKADGITVAARSEQDKAHFQWARQRFVEEGRTLADLHHPSILPIYEIFEEHGTACLVTAFIDGENLEEWLGKVRHPAEKDLQSIAVSLLDALEIVHERGYLHRDVKPENILIDRRNSRPILIDFGNARIATGAKTTNLTAVLSKGYAPFEQYQTKGRQGPCTDIYALGAVLYRAIKGVAPEDSADRLEQDKVEPLSRRPPPGYSREFLATVDKAMQMRRENRWQTCGEWKAALGASDRSEPDPRPVPKPSKTVLAAVALGLLTVAGVGIGLWINHLQEDAGHNASASSPAVAEIKVTPGNATVDRPFVDSLGQEFVPVPGTNVLFCRWDTRLSDWQAFIQMQGDTAQWGIFAIDDKEVKWTIKKNLSWMNPGFAQTSRHPVVGVSWQDAHRFCAWLSKKEGRTYRLPSDAEWSTAVGRRKYPWGGEFPPPAGVGNYCGGESRLTADASGTNAWTTIQGYNDGFARTSPTGSFAPNEYGLYDMGGNVWQWCEDAYKFSMNSPAALEKYPTLKQEKDDDGTIYRVLRGASWYDDAPTVLESMYRARGYPTTRIGNDGFRCVLVISGD